MPRRPNVHSGLPKRPSDAGPASDPGSAAAGSLPASNCGDRPTGKLRRPVLPDQLAEEHCPGNPNGNVGRRSMGMGTLARRVAGWTSNLIVTIIIVLASIACGRQIVQWWHEGSPPEPAGAVPTLTVPDELSGPHTVVFGNCAWTMQRRVLEGTGQEIETALLEECRAAVRQAPFPDGEPGEQETKLIERLAGEEPVDKGSNWAIYRLAKPLVMMAGLRWTGSAVNPPEEPGQPVATGRTRVVVWAIGIRSRQTSWAAYVFRRNGPQTVGMHTASPIELPQEIRRVMGIGTPDGTYMLAIEGADPLSKSRVQLDRSLFRSGWHPRRPWQWTGAAWTRAYVDQQDNSLDVYLAPHKVSGWTGLVVRGSALIMKGNWLGTDRANP